MNKDELIQNKILSTFHLSREPAINIKLTKKSIDFKKWANSKEIYNFLFSNSSKYLEIKTTVFNRTLNEIVNKLPTFDSFQACIETNKIKVSKELLNFIKDNWENKENIQKILFSPTHNNINEFFELSKIAKEKYKENSVWSLFIGAYFLVGKIEGNVAAPIVNVPIRIKKTVEGTVVLEKIIENTNFKFTINEKLNHWINKQLKIAVPNDVPQNYEWFNNYAIWLQSIIHEKSIITSDFVQAKFNIDEHFVIQPSVTISLYDPTGGVVMRDYQKISNSNVDPFKIIDIVTNSEKYREEILNSDNLIEINKPLNIYQKYAIASCLKTPTLIYGPPGTGKSEVIANLIANIVNNNKNVLVCSEKAAAINVIEERLGDLNALSLSAYDLNEKDKFFEKIRNIQAKIQEKPSHVDLITETQEYDQILSFLKNTTNVIEIADKCGGLEKIENMISKTEMEYFQSLRENLFFEKLQELSEINGKKTPIEQFEWLLSVHKLIKNNMFMFEQLLQNGFDNFTRNDINGFIFKYEKKKKDKLLKKFLKFNKKSNFLSDPNTIQIERLKWENLIEQIRDLNITKLNWTDIMFLKQFNYLDYDQYHNDLMLKLFLELLEKSDYKNYELLNKLLRKYNEAKEKNTKDNATKIVNNYLSDFIAKLSKMTQNEKEKFNKLFSFAQIKKTPEINGFIKEFFDCLKIIFPIWCLSPIQTCSVTKCEPNIFDYGIFDEASQMFVENAIPLVYRCKLNTVAGDDKQLQPTSFFISRDFDDCDDYDSIEDSIDAQVNSLFEQATSSLWNKYYLRNHYRSDNASLIDFSNKYLYENKLQTATKNGCFNLGLEVHTVKGVYENKTNTFEALRLIEHLVDNYSQKDKYEEKKVLVITFNINQKELIEREFFKATNNKLWIRDAYQNDLICFKNLENVQGDEADIVYLSVCYGRNSEGNIRQSFGPLSIHGGENRLNVAITRAKSKMYVFKSLVGSDIHNMSNKHTRLFAGWISYCDAIEKSLNVSQYIQLEEKQTDDSSNIINQIYEFIQNQALDERYQLSINYPISSEKIPIVIFDTKTNYVRLAIMIDDSYKDGREKAIEKYDLCKFINDRNYPVYIINHLDWTIKQEIIKKDLLKIVQKLNSIAQKNS